MGSIRARAVTDWVSFHQLQEPLRPVQSRKDPEISRAPLSPYQPVILFSRSSIYPSYTYDCPRLDHLTLRITDTMAIHPKLHPQGPQGSLSPQQTMAISAWTEQAAASLEDLSLSESASAERPAQTSAPARSSLRGATTGLSIPLDDEPTPSPRVKVIGPTSTSETRPPAVSFRRREPLRRDSLKRREALLKGKDGSRRRQRWENGMRVHGAFSIDSTASPS